MKPRRGRRAQLGKPNTPCKDQTEKSIKNWLIANLKVGATVAIRHTQGGMLRYERAVVLSIRPRNFALGALQSDGSFAESGMSFAYSGRNYREPTGQTRLVVPTPAVLAACDACHFGERALPGGPWVYIFV